jgi:hypothetical protein
MANSGLKALALCGLCRSAVATRGIKLSPAENFDSMMFHFNFVTGMNRQGGPRGVTKAESAN